MRVVRCQSKKNDFVVITFSGLPSIEYFSFLSPALIKDPVRDLIFFRDPDVDLFTGPDLIISFLGLNLGIS